MSQEPLESQYPDTPSGWSSRWALEFEAAKKEVEPFHRRGQKVVDRYLDKGSGARDGRIRQRRLNLYTANVQTLQAIVYGKTPQVDVSRKFSDAQDSAARVAAEMMERLANGDIQKDSDTYSVAMNHALEDRLIPGMGNVRLRYVCEFEEVPEVPAIMGVDPMTGAPVERSPAVPAGERKSYECVEVDYVPWRDQLWSPARTFGEVRWWGFLAQLSRKELVEKFGAIGKLVPLNSKRAKGGTDSSDAKQADPWSRADVWEIWDKENECLWFYVEGFDKVLTPVGVGALDSEAVEAPEGGEEAEMGGGSNGSVPDPLELDGFWPFPVPLAANTTTTSFMPQSDFVVSQDLYDEIDDYTSRIGRLEKAIKVAGVYDKEAGSQVEKLINEADENQLIPVSNWGTFAEKGGIEGRIQWLPLDQIIGALDKLRELRSESIQLLYQVSGFSDIMRGQASTNTTATEQSIKAKFASVRVQRFQDEFAKFCSDTQKIKLEIVSKHFDPQTIIRQSNIERTKDGQDPELVQQAVGLIKSDFYQYRVEVKPESVSLTDYAALRTERVDFMGGVAQFFQFAMPMAQTLPGAEKYLLELFQWYLTGFKGSQTIQGVMDQAISEAEARAKQQAAQPPQPPPPDPKLQAQALKGQQEQQSQQSQLQSDLVRLNAETQAAVQQRHAESIIDVREEAAKAQIKGSLDAAMNAAINPMGAR